MKNKIIKIEGMTCGHCQMRVKKALENIPGVTAEVDYKTGTAVVKAYADIDDKLLKETVEEQNYKVISVEQS
ncbi:MAG: heavy metal-associated domain-containing protein [Endomicrobiaceae bacterium]|nr:heavy metal-associated domain-containing protein [Endomicrobiaceae bacterium]